MRHSIVIGVLLCCIGCSASSEVNPTNFLPPTITATLPQPTSTLLPKTTSPPIPTATPPPTRTPTPLPPDPFADVDPSGQTITFWHNHLYERGLALSYIVANFNVENPYDITVVEQFRGGTDDLFTRFLSAEEPPHLVVSYQNQAASYFEQGHIIDLTLLMDSPTWGIPSDERADYFTPFIAGDRFPQYEDAQLAFPANRSMEVMYYNADWLAQLRDEELIAFDGPPQTPEQFRQAACAAADDPFREGTTPIGYAIMVDASRIASWAFAFGGHIYDDAANIYTYDSPLVIEAMTFLQTLVAEGCAQVITARFGDQDVFGTGTALFTVNTSSGIPFYEQAVNNRSPFAWSVATVPHTTPEPVQNLYGPSISIRDASPKEVLASWLFLRAYTRPAPQADWARGSGYFPVRQSAAASMEAFMADNPAYAAAFELLPYGASEPATADYNAVREAAAMALQAILSGADVMATLQALNTEVNAP